HGGGTGKERLLATIVPFVCDQANDPRIWIDLPQPRDEIDSATERKIDVDERQVWRCGGGSPDSRSCVRNAGKKFNPLVRQQKTTKTFPKSCVMLHGKYFRSRPTLDAQCPA